MNGRLYDPVLGRILSPDPYIQLPGFAQNYNRYSYVWNNPLKYNDPNGKWIIAVLSTLANMYWGGVTSNGYEFNPKNWDWSNPSTYGGVALGGYNGYNYGVNLEGRYNNISGAQTGNSTPVWSDEFKSYVYPESVATFEYKSSLTSIPIRYLNPEMPRYTISQKHTHTLKQYKPTWVDRWSESESFFKKTTYDLVDGASVTAQSFFRGPNAQHLTGQPVYGSDRVDAFVNTVEWGIPTGKVSTFKKIPNGIYSKWLDLRIQAHAHPLSPKFGKYSFSMSPWHININNSHFIPNPTYWRVYYPWQFVY